MSSEFSNLLTQIKKMRTYNPEKEKDTNPGEMSVAMFATITKAIAQIRTMPSANREDDTIKPR